MQANQFKDGFVEDTTYANCRLYFGYYFIKGFSKFLNQPMLDDRIE